MSRVLMFSHVKIFLDKKQFTFGPGIRIWEIAKALRKKGHKITIVEKNRKIVGFRIAGIAKGSALHAIGLRNDDVVVAVNGYKLTSIDEVLLAVSALKFAKKYRVDLLRGGKRRSLYYRVETSKK